MSSFNDSSDFTSQNDSIPLDEDYSGSVSASASVSYYSDDVPVDTSGSSSVSGTGSGAGYSSVSRSNTQVSPSASHITGISEDYTETGYTHTETGYNSPSEARSGSLYNDEYTSGYGSLSYDDSSLRSPRSTSFSDMSSTFASFYRDNPTIQRICYTAHFLRRPLFFFCAISASSLIGTVCRVARVMTVEQSTILKETLVTRTGPGPVPSGYPDIPAWLSDVRASLPVGVEKPVRSLLSWYGIPALSELQRSSQAVVTRVAESMQGVSEAWRAGGTVIPMALFLPAFSYLLLSVARNVVARKPDPRDYLNFSDIEDDDRNLFGDGTDDVNHEEDPDVLRLPREGIEGDEKDGGTTSTVESAHVLDYSQSIIEQNSIEPKSPPTFLGGVTDRSGADGAEEEEFDGIATVPAQVAALSLPHNPRAKSRSSTQAPTDERRTPLTIPASQRSLSPSDLDDDDDDVSDAAAPGSNTKGMASRYEFVDPVKKESAENGAGESGKRLSASPGPREPAAQIALGRGGGGGGATSTNYALDGTVVVALCANHPTAAEVATLLVAAAKYHCSAVILPNTAEEDSAISIPPSMHVERVPDVLARSAEVAAAQGMSVIGVFSAADAAPSAILLPSFTHPVNAIYVFAPDAQKEVVSAVVASTHDHICAGATRAPFAVNECFYDRFVKEKRQRRQQLQGSDAAGKEVEPEHDEL